MSTLSEGAWTVAQIVFVNAVLSGDNALVIALTAQQLPTGMRRKAVLWGSALAVFLQVAFAILVGRLLEIPGLRLAGAVALLLIARKLIGASREEFRSTRASSSVTGAVLTILVANLAMSLDNVLAVGALSRGLPALIALGLGVSAVMLLAASALMIALIERYRWVTLAGAAILAFTGAGMICEEPLLGEIARVDIDAPPPVLTEEDAQTEAAIVAQPAEGAVQAAAGDATRGLTSRWSLAVYGMAFSLCFGKLRWWNVIRRFERERAAVVDAEALSVYG